MTNDSSNPAQPGNPGADKRVKLYEPHVVERLLVGLTREAVNSQIAAIRGIISDQDAATVADKEIHQRALIFLGRDKNYATTPDWNVAGKIDVALAQKLQLDAQGAEAIVKAALARFVADVLERVDLAKNPNITESEWKERTRELVATYCDLFGGIRSRAAATGPIVAEQASAPTPSTSIFNPSPAPAPAVAPVTPAAPKYLGDPHIIAEVLTELAVITLKAHQAAASGKIAVEDAIAVEGKEIQDGTKIFLGADKRYVVDPNWNAPGVMDAFLAEQLQLLERGQEPVIAATLTKFLAELHAKIGSHDSVMLPEPQWKPLVGEVVERFRNLMLGLPPEGPVPTQEIAKVQDEPAAVPDWLQPEAKPVATTAPQPALPVQPKPQPVPEPVTSGDSSPSRKRGAVWVVAGVTVVAVGIAAFVFISRGTKIEKPVEVAVVKEPVKKEPPRQRAFMLRDGKIVSPDGTEIKSQGEAAPAEGQGEVTDAGESKHLEFWYDVNTASGVARFLVAMNRDPGFTADFDAPVAWDLWLTDEMGGERLIHKSVFRAKFSPDGTKIAYTTSDSVLYVEDLEGKRLARTSRAYEPNWSGDGKIIVFEQVPNGVVLYPPQAFQLARFDWENDKVEIITDGGFDDVIPHYHPSGNWILFVSGERTGGASFWKVPAVGGQPVQLTNLRFNEMETDTVPTPYRTTVWSDDGKWFLYDFKAGAMEQTWGLEFDDNGMFKRAVKVSDGLSPQWTGPASFMCQKRSADGFEMVQERLPGT